MQGDSVDIGEDGKLLGQWADLSMVRKVYKLEAPGGGKKQGANGANGVVTQVDEKKQMEGVILGIMTIKGS